MNSNGESLNCLQALLQAAHRGGPVSEASFEVVESPDAVSSCATWYPCDLITIHQDLAFELDFDSFKWRWETYRLGPKTSADVLSRHLIIPLISLSHLSFNSADPVSELGETDLEKVCTYVH